MIVLYLSDFEPVNQGVFISWLEMETKDLERLHLKWNRERSFVCYRASIERYIACVDVRLAG